MRIIQKPFSDNHKSAMFFHGMIAIGKKDREYYTLETEQDGEISYEDKNYVGAETPELAKLDEVFDADIEAEEIVEIYVDKFFAIKKNGRLVDADLLIFNEYDEAIREFEIFLNLLS